MPPSGMWRRLGLVGTDVSEEIAASILRGRASYSKLLMLFLARWIFPRLSSVPTGYNFNEASNSLVTDRLNIPSYIARSLKVVPDNPYRGILRCHLSSRPRNGRMVMNRENKQSLLTDRVGMPVRREQTQTEDLLPPC
jgi:hypothetical protein